MSTIQLRTAIPGPKSRELMRRRQAAVARGVAHATPIFAARAEGAVLEDVDGNRFLDFAGGIGVVNAGHRAPRVVAAVREQLDAFIHTCFSVAPYEKYIALAEKLNSLVPGAFPKKSILVNSGAEAIENAMKIARAYTRRPAIICFEDAFHGRTMLTMSLTSKTHPYKAGFEPFATEIYRIPYAYCYRCSYSLQYPSCGVFCAHHLEDTFKRVVASETVAAVVVEPVLGEGGFVAPPKEFFAIMQDICKRHGILFIADEVQTGFGRTSAMFASRALRDRAGHTGQRKILAAGMPLAAVTGRAEMMDAAGVGGLGGTYGGNPLACAAALAAIETIERENLPERARKNRPAVLNERRRNGEALAAYRRSSRPGSDARYGIGSLPRDARTGQRGNRTDLAPLPRTRLDSDVRRQLRKCVATAGAFGHYGPTWTKAWTCCSPRSRKSPNRRSKPPRALRSATRNLILRPRKPSPTLSFGSSSEVATVIARIPAITESDIGEGIGIQSLRIILPPIKTRRSPSPDARIESAAESRRERNTSARRPRIANTFDEYTMKVFRVMASTAGTESIAKMMSIASTATKASSRGVASSFPRVFYQKTFTIVLVKRA